MFVLSLSLSLSSSLSIYTQETEHVALCDFQSLKYHQISQSFQFFIFFGSGVKMEPSSKNFPEQCQSSESGWTMYIGSSIYEDGSGGGGGGGYPYHSGGRKKTAVENDEVETDDSMASDASSGPGGGKTEEGKGKSKILTKKCKKPLEKRKDRRENGRKHEDNDEEKCGVSSVQSRNSVWFWGRK